MSALPPPFLLAVLLSRHHMVWKIPLVSLGQSPPETYNLLTGWGGGRGIGKNKSLDNTLLAHKPKMLHLTVCYKESCFHLGQTQYRQK